MLELYKVGNNAVDRKSKKFDEKNVIIEDESSEPTSGESQEETLEPVMSFDVYFVMRLKENSKTHPHHKAPMRRFALDAGLEDGTKSEFEALFKTY